MSPNDNPQRWIATIIRFDGDLPPLDTVVTLTRDDTATLVDVATAVRVGHGRGIWRARVNEQPDTRPSWGATVLDALCSVVAGDKLPGGLVVRWRREGEPSDDDTRTKLDAMRIALEIAAKFVPVGRQCDSAHCEVCPDVIAQRKIVDAALDLWPLPVAP